MKEFITIVSGLPRSGTSMMMKILASGGVPVAVDGRRVADDDNPQGYFELEQVKQIRQDHTWLDAIHGKAVKLVSMLLYDLPAGREYRIVFMRRDIDEVLASQRVMLERMGKGADFDGVALRRMFTRHLDEVLEWARGREGTRLLEVRYRDVLEKPESEVAKVNEFLGGGLAVDAMVRCVDKDLYRQRASGAPAGGDEECRSGTGASDEREQEKIEDQLRSLGYM